MSSDPLLAIGRPVANLHRYGNALVHFDPKAEAALRLKIDLYIVPTVALLYLFCFIDRANIGMCKPRPGSLHPVERFV